MTEQIFIPEELVPAGAWQQPGNTGNTGGGSAAPHGSYSISHTDLVSVSPVAGSPWDTYYFFNELPFDASRTRFAQGISFILPTDADISACQALEWELEQCVFGDVWNMGWQWSFNPLQLNLFDYTKKIWVPTSIVAPTPTAGQLVTFNSEHIIGTNIENHVALWVNGSRSPVTFSQPKFPNRWPSSANYLHYAFQFDSKGQGVPFNVEVLGTKARAL